MTSTPTDRYVSATVSALDDAQRSDVERELRATIEDMVQARADAGEPPADAERAVLTELGDPMRLAAGYSGRPLHLVGPGVYPEWLRLVRVLLAVVVPISVVGNLVARLFVEDLTTTDIGSLVVGGLAMAVTVAVHVVFWTTLVFVVLERTGHSSLDTWTPDQLPDTGDPGRVGFGETAASVVFLVLVGLALVWQQTSSPVMSGGETVPVLDPALWSGWVPWLLVVLLAQAVLAVVVFRQGRWTRTLAGTSLLLDLAFAVPLLVLLRSGDLFNDAFVDRLVSEGWADAERDLTVSTTIGVLVVLVWSIVETLRRVRAARR
jgi:hypothetical protein